MVGQTMVAKERNVGTTVVGNAFRQTIKFWEDL